MVRIQKEQLVSTVGACATLCACVASSGHNQKLELKSMLENSKISQNRGRQSRLLVAEARIGLYESIYRYPVETISNKLSYIWMALSGSLPCKRAWVRGEHTALECTLQVVSKVSAFLWCVVRPSHASSSTQIETEE